jgi:hypothetical protein
LLQRRIFLLALKGWREGDPRFMAATSRDRLLLRNMLCAWVNCFRGKMTGGKKLWAAARQRSRSSRGGTEERECTGVNEV